MNNWKQLSEICFPANYSCFTLIRVGGKGYEKSDKMQCYIFTALPASYFWTEIEPPIQLVPNSIRTYFNFIGGTSMHVTITMDTRILAHVIN